MNDILLLVSEKNIWPKIHKITNYSIKKGRIPFFNNLMQIGLCASTFGPIKNQTSLSDNLSLIKYQTVCANFSCMKKSE